MSLDRPTVTIYSDGGAAPNPGPGGWGVVLIVANGSQNASENGNKPTIQELSGGAADTTNNRMELTAAIEALRSLKQPSIVEFYTDSQYVKKGINEWMENWLRTNFKNGTIQNVDLWRALNAEVARHEIRWHWVKGHAGNKYNERVDQLATAARTGSNPGSVVEISTIKIDPAITRAYLRVSCQGAPGAGAWAVLIDRSGTDRPADETILTEGSPKTYANRLDLLAAIAALEAINSDERAQLVTGNSYLHTGITQWVAAWKRSNWIKKTGGEVQYRELWQRLDELNQQRKPRWILCTEANRPAELDRLDAPLQKAIDAAKRK